MKQIKGLDWEVTTRQEGIYYKGRGGTPEQALEDLVRSLDQGIKHTTADLEALENKRGIIVQTYEEIVGPLEIREEA